jgi:hypothetical protein
VGTGKYRIVSFIRVRCRSGSTGGHTWYLSCRNRRDIVERFMGQLLRRRCMS